MLKINRKLKDYLLRRAHYRCEYCKLPITFDNCSIFELEHVIPFSISNTNDPDKLAVACIECNRLKSDKITWKDPEDGNIVRLFNPRKDTWESHFEVSSLSSVIIGKTPIGRATSDLLQLNKKLSNIFKLFDNDLLTLHNYNIVSRLSLLRYLRLTCDFDRALDLAKILFNEVNESEGKYIKYLQFFIAVQIIEIFFTRSTNEKEILRGINCCRNFKLFFLKNNKRNILDLSIFDYFYLTFIKQLSTLNPNKYSSSYINILKKETDRIKSLNDVESKILYLRYNVSYNNSISTSDINFVKNNLTYLNELKEQNCSGFITTIIRLADILIASRNIFYDKSDIIIKNMIDAYNIITIHYPFDITLFSLIQRRMLSLNFSYDLSEYTLSKKALIDYSKKYNLFNEQRRIMEVV